MTRIQILEEQKQVFVDQKTELENARSDIYVREEQALSDGLFPYFSGFNPDVYVEVTRGSLYFKMDHPEVNYRKEIFTLYLRENWDFEKNKKTYDGIDLSYYTTSTKGMDTWELKRLRLLGDVAGILLKDQQSMVDVANWAVARFKEEYKKVYDQMNLIGKAIRELDEKISQIKSEEILTQLSSEEGIIFLIPKDIELKRTYCPKLDRIRIIESKGKTCTVAIEMGGGSYKTTESRVNVESLIKQIRCYNIL